MSPRSKTPFSSISRTSGLIFSSANWRTLSRNRISSSVSATSGGGAFFWAVAVVMGGLKIELERSILKRKTQKLKRLGLLARVFGPDSQLVSAGIVKVEAAPARKGKDGLGDFTARLADFFLHGF